MKQFLRGLIRRAGYEPLHYTANPVLQSLLEAYNELRLHPLEYERRTHVLSRLASLCHLQQILRLEEIDLLLDVGANRGQFALDARRTGYSGQIISFEPLRAHQERLRTLAAKDGRWRVFPYALGSIAGELTLNVYKDDTFSSLHLVNDGARRSFGSMVELDHVERVQVRTVDELADELDLTPNRRIFLKTDTQGHDAAVLEGAYRSLEHVRCVLTEATVASLYDGSSTLDEITTLLLSLGFVRGGMFPIAYTPGTFALIELDCYFTRVNSAG